MVDGKIRKFLKMKKSEKSNSQIFKMKVKAVGSQLNAAREELALFFFRSSAIKLLSITLATV